MGGCIGSLFTEWSPIDKEEFAVDAGPMDGNGLCMQISFRF